MTAARLKPQTDWKGILVTLGVSLFVQFLGGVWIASSQSTRLGTVEEDVKTIKTEYVHKNETEREINRIDKHLDKIDDKLDKLLENRSEPQK